MPFDPKGKLDIPVDANPVFLEPALVMEVKSSLYGGRYLFGKPPKHDKKSYVSSLFNSDTQENIDLDNRNHKFIHKKTVTGEREAWIVDHIFFDSEKVLARPIEASSNRIFEVAVFEKIDDKNMEAEYKIIKKGFMYKEDLRYTHHKFVEFKEDIFKHPPSAADIIQGGMGNCFLVSALIAILRSEDGQEFIMNMMKQQNDGTTIVKLSDPRTFKPIFVRVANSVYHINGKPTSEHTAYWVQMIEKAYVGLGIQKAKENKDEYKITHRSFLQMFNKGGDPEVAMTILTGLPSQALTIVNPEIHPFSFDDARIAQSLVDVFYTQDPNVADPGQAINDKLIEWKAISPLMQILDELNLLLAWGKYVKMIRKESYDLVYAEYKRICEPATFYTHNKIAEIITRIENLHSLDILLPAPPKEIIAKFKVKLLGGQWNDQGKKVYQYPGRVGSGEYMQHHYDLFSQISTLLTNTHNIATAHTPTDFNENEGAGLVSNHAYAVIGVLTKIIQGKELMFVRLRNPWGRKGRIYDFGNDEKYVQNGKISCGIDDEGCPEFDLDISEFTHYFCKYQIGEFPTACAQKLSPNVKLKSTISDNNNQPDEWVDEKSLLNINLRYDQ